MNDFPKLRAAWITYLEAEFEPSIELMLGMGLPASTEALNKAARRFCCEISRQGNGPRWSKKPAEEWLWAIGFHEHMDSNQQVVSRDVV
jgi:hypothetical protein